MGLNDNNSGSGGSEGIVLFGAVVLSSFCCCVVVAIVYYYYKNPNDRPSWVTSFLESLGVAATQAPTSTAINPTKTKSITPKPKSSTTIPINKKVIIYSNTCKSGKSILSTDDTATSARNNNIALWCQVNGMDGGGIWNIEKVSGNNNKGFHYIRHSKTRQLLTAWPGIAHTYLQNRAQGNIKAQQWSIKPFSGGYGFIIENRLLKEKGQYAVLDANGRGCTDGRKTWESNGVLFWNKKTSKQVWKIIAAKTDTDVSKLTNLSVCVSGDYYPNSLVGANRRW